MLHSRSYLELCHELLKLEHRFTPRSGLRICRGFADVGYEEYSLLSESKMVSLSTGKTGALDDDFERHYFPVYEPDEISTLLYEAGWDIESLQFPDQRRWELAVKNGERELRLVAQTLEELFLRALIEALKDTNVSAKK